MTKQFIALLTVVFVLKQLDNLCYTQNHQWLFLTNRHSVELIDYSINPNNPVIQISKLGNRWDNQIGFKIGLFAVSNTHSTHTLILNGLISLNDYIPKTEFSWHLWRGCFGLEYKNLINSKPANKLSYAFSAGFFHESDHVTNFLDYRADFLKIDGSKTNFFRSFEYIKFGIDVKYKILKNKLILATISEFKIFPKPNTPSEITDLKRSFSIEGIVDYSWSDKWILFMNLYYETIFNDFHTNEDDYIYQWSGENIIYQDLEIGIRYKFKNKKAIVLFAKKQNSNGKGMDFHIKYEDFGGGIKILW